VQPIGQIGRRHRVHVDQRHVHAVLLPSGHHIGDRLVVGGDSLLCRRVGGRNDGRDHQRHPGGGPENLVDQAAEPGRSTAGIDVPVHVVGADVQQHDVGLVGDQRGVRDAGDVPDRLK